MSVFGDGKRGERERERGREREGEREAEGGREGASPIELGLN
jgi:hypothetical protein